MRRPSPAAWSGMPRRRRRAGRSPPRSRRGRWWRRRRCRRPPRGGRSPRMPATRWCRRLAMVLLASPAGRLRRATRGTRRAIAATSGSTRGERSRRLPSTSTATPVVVGPSAVTSTSAAASAEERRTSRCARRSGARPSSTPTEITRHLRAAPMPSSRSTISRVTSAARGPRCRRGGGRARRTARARRAAPPRRPRDRPCRAAAAGPGRCPVRRITSAGVADSATTGPAASIAARFGSRHAAPPPVAITVPRIAAAVPIAAASRARNRVRPRSRRSAPPSLTPASRVMTSSRSTNSEAVFFFFFVLYSLTYCALLQKP